MAAETIGERIRRLRSERQLTVGELAFKLGITENALRKIESGESKAPSFTTGARLAHELGVSAMFLAFGQDRTTMPNQPSSVIAGAAQGGQGQGRSTLPADEERLERLEADLREMRKIVKELEPYLEQIANEKERQSKESQPA